MSSWLWKKKAKVNNIELVYINAKELEVMVAEEKQKEPKNIGDKMKR